MFLAFDTLPNEIHYLLQTYLSMQDTISLSHSSVKLQKVYRPLSFRTCRVTLMDHKFKSSRLHPNSNRRLIPTQVLFDPDNYSWFPNECVIKAFSDESLDKTDEYWNALLNWISICNWKLHFPNLKSLVVRYWVFVADHQGFSKHSHFLTSIFNSRIEAQPTITGVTLMVYDTRDPENAFEIPRHLYSTVSQLLIPKEVTALPPLKYFSNLSKISLKRVHDDVFTHVITSVSKYCPLLRFIQSEHKLKVIEDSLHGDSGFLSLSMLPEYVNSSVIICNLGVIPIVKFPSNNQSFRQIKKISFAPLENSIQLYKILYHLPLPGLEIAELRDLIQLAPVFLKQIPKYTGEIDTLSKVRKLSFRYNSEIFSGVAHQFATLFSSFKSLVNLSVASERLFKCNLEPSQVYEFFIPARKIVASGKEVTDADFDEITQKAVDVIFSPQIHLTSEYVQKIKNIIFNPTKYVQYTGDDHDGIDMLLDDIHAAEFFVSCVASLPALECLELQYFNFISIQLQKLVETSNTLKQITFPNVLYDISIFSDGAGVLPISKYIYRTNSLFTTWVLDLEQRKYYNGFGEHKLYIKEYDLIAHDFVDVPAFSR